MKKSQEFGCFIFPGPFCASDFAICFDCIVHGLIGKQLIGLFYYVFYMRLCGESHRKFFHQGQVFWERIDEGGKVGLGIVEKFVIER